MLHPEVSKRNDLPKLFLKLGYQVGAEIGTERGRFAQIICETIPDVRLYCIDPWERYPGYKSRSTEVYQEFYAQAAARLGKYDVSFLHKKSMDAISDFADASLDFVYIDGNHTFDYVMEDIIAWGRKVRKGGIVSGHDYYEFPSGTGGVIQAVNAYVYSHRIHPVYFTKDRAVTWFWEKK